MVSVFGVVRDIVIIFLLKLEFDIELGIVFSIGESFVVRVFRVLFWERRGGLWLVSF